MLRMQFGQQENQIIQEIIQQNSQEIRQEKIVPLGINCF